MNWTRGLRRLWIVASVAWATYILILGIQFGDFEEGKWFTMFAFMLAAPQGYLRSVAPGDEARGGSEIKSPTWRHEQRREVYCRHRSKNRPRSARRKGNKASLCGRDCGLRAKPLRNPQIS
jgi:hypothetical protein